MNSTTNSTIKATMIIKATIPSSTAPTALPVDISCSCLMPIMFNTSAQTHESIPTNGIQPNTGRDHSIDRWYHRCCTNPHIHEEEEQRRFREWEITIPRASRAHIVIIGQYPSGVQYW